MKTIRILCVGDVVGATGRSILQKHLDRIRTQHKIDAVIVNGENSAQGKGITPDIAMFFKGLGVQVVTTGNHVWDKRDIIPYITVNKDLLRPANYPSETPGVGVTTFTVNGITVGVINLQGRVFMRELVDCPFRSAASILTYLHHRTNVIVVDFHAETTSEKMALAYYLDGKVSALVGTHTHVQTADERVLPGGTAYITDLGMVGSLNSMIGMKKEPIIQQFLTQMPTRYTVDTSAPGVLSGVWIEIDCSTGKAIKIERVRIVDNDLVLSQSDD